MKRLTIILLVIAMALSVFSGCTTGKEKEVPVDGTKPETTEASAPKEPKINEYGWEVPEETMEVTFYGSQESQTNFDKFGPEIDEFLLENFNLKITRINYDSDRDERLNLMLATNDYPEILDCINESQMRKWASLGKLLDLNPLVQEYGPNILSNMGEDLYKRYIDADGKVYGLPDGYGILGVLGFGAQVRLDWYKEIGSPEFSTPDEYYEVLKQMVAKHPTNENGEKVYALSDYIGGFGYTRPYTRLSGYWGLKWDWKENPDGTMTYWLNTDEGLEYTKWLNKVYREGMLDPDSFTMRDEDWAARMTNNRVAGSLVRVWECMGAGNEAWMKLLGDKWTDDMRYVPYIMKDPEAENAYLNGLSPMGWGFTVITDSCKQPEAIMKLFDYMNTAIGTRVFGWGVPNMENSAWNFYGPTIDDWEFNEPVMQAVMDQTFDYDKLTALGYWKYQMCQPDKSFPDGTTWGYDSCPAIKAANKWLVFKDETLKSTIWDRSAMNAIKWPADNPATTIKTQIVDICDAGFATAVMSKTEAQCEENFFKMRERAIKAGLETYEEYFSTEYKKNIDAWK